MGVRNINMKNSFKAHNILYSILLGFILKLSLERVYGSYNCILKLELFNQCVFYSMVIYFIANCMRYFFANIELNEKIDEDIKRESSFCWKILRIPTINGGIIEMGVLACIGLSLFPSIEGYTYDWTTRSMLPMYNMNDGNLKKFVFFYCFFNLILVAIDLVWTELLLMYSKKQYLILNQDPINKKEFIWEWRNSAIVEVIIFFLLSVSTGILLLMNISSIVIFKIFFIFMFFLYGSLILEALELYTCIEKKTAQIYSKIKKTYNEHKNA